MSKFTFSKTTLDRLPLPTTGECGGVGYVIHWDDQGRGSSGLGVIVRPSGQKTFILAYRHANRAKRITLGRMGRITVEQARDAAKSYNGVLAQGRDPAAERATARKAKTLNEVVDLFIAEHLIGPNEAEPLCAEESIRSCRRMRRFIADGIGKKLVTEIDDVAVRGFLNSVRRKGFNTNRSYLSTSWRWGQENGYISKNLPNPCVDIKPLPSVPQGRNVSKEEYAAILRAVNEMMGERKSDPARLLACLFVAYTGCRPIEAARLRREFVDRKAGVAKLHEHKNFKKTGKPKVFSLDGPIGALIDRAEAVHTARADNCPFVFPRRGKQKASRWLARTWKAICRRAGVKIDLRHLRSGLINALDDEGLTQKEVAGVTQHMSLDTINRHYRAIEQKKALKDAGRAAALIASFGGDDNRAPV
jgi:integrase